MKIDLAKRRRVMQRSMKLGHCICDPRRPCPCDVFTSGGYCPCAGERPEPAPAGAAAVKLTELVRNAGCASKIPAADLEAVLSRLPAVKDPAVLSGLAAGDDAGIYKLTDELCLVQTVDVMTPCVDDPRTFGRICAANCLSDIYAMGGVPRTALSVLGFPSDRLDGRIMYEMLAGAMEVLEQAGVALIGGHSVKDEEIKLGFAVTGVVSATAAARHDTAKVGDVLVLTKPLGVGVLNFARQIGRGNGDFAAVEAAMAELNKPAAEAMNAVTASACTDVTGFGLFGHLISMARHSGVTAEIWADALPAFAGAVEALADGVIPGAIERNSEYVGDDLAVVDGADPARVLLGYDAQTSGGLLISIPAARHAALLAELARRNVSAWTIGRIIDSSTGKISVTNRGDIAATGSSIENRQLKIENQDPPMPDKAQPHSCCSPAPANPCCPDAPAGAADGASAQALRDFGSFMRSVSAGGALDERTKELITFACVLLARCGPCLDAHMKKALSMGISQEELDEAAWCAIAMGGAPVRMFYEAGKK